MRKAIFLLAAFIVVASYTACESDMPVFEQKPEPEPTEASIEISETEIALDDANSYTLTFKSSHDWTISSSDNWCSLSPASGKAGEASVIVSGQANESAADRSTILTIKADKAQATVRVLQLKKELPPEPTEASIEIDDTEITLDETNAYTLTFTASHDWTISVPTGWCSLSPVEGKAGEASVVVSGQTNESAADRSTILTIKADKAQATVQVIQKGKTVIVDPEDIPIPDVYFRQRCLDSFDTDRNGKISLAEAEAVEVINVYEWRVQSLEGIEYFTSITELYCDNNVNLTSLDLSKNTKLTVLYCQHNSLINLNISSCTELTELVCGRNLLPALDISKNKKLQLLMCDNNLLTNLDVSHNMELAHLSCSRNEDLTVLDVSKNLNLESLSCSHQTTLDISKNTNLISLYCNDNPNLTTLDLSKNTKLIEIMCRENPKLTTIDVSNNRDLRTLDCFDNPNLTEIWLAAGQSIYTINKDPHTEIKYK